MFFTWKSKELEKIKGRNSVRFRPLLISVLYFALKLGLHSTANADYLPAYIR